METRIFARNMKLNERSEDYIQKKIARLERHLPENAPAKFEVSRTAARSQAERFVAQMTISAGGATLRGQKSALTLFAAVDAVADVMDKQIRRYTGKAYRTAPARRWARKSARQQDADALLDEPDDAPDYDADSPDEWGDLVRVKRFAMKPMSAEEAIVEMELLDHSFFMFRNSEIDDYSVVYRRSDGGYGIIEPSAG